MWADSWMNLDIESNGPKCRDTKSLGHEQNENWCYLMLALKAPPSFLLS